MTGGKVVPGRPFRAFAFAHATPLKTRDADFTRELSDLVFVKALVKE